MQRLAGILVVTVTGIGCDRVFGLEDRDRRDGGVGDAGVDVAIDAPPPGNPCLGRAPAPLLCADFDEAEPRAYLSGAPIAIPLDGAGVIIERRPPSTTGPNGYRMRSTGGPRTLTVTQVAAAARQLDATFALRIGSLSATTGTTGLFRISLPDTCNVELELDPSRAMLVVQGQCGSNRPSADLALVSMPSTWLQIHLTLDIMTGSATASVNGQVPIEIPLGVPTMTSAIPSASFGIDTSGHAGLEVGYDDITVRMD